MKIKYINVFETNNRINVNVFSYDNDTGKVYTLRISTNSSETVVNLFYFNEHYGVVKNLSRLVSSQKSKNKGPKFICMRCLNHFRSKHVLDNHLEWCSKQDHLRHIYQNFKTNTECFKQYQRVHRIPFVVYAGFECFLSPIDIKVGKGTVQYQHHTPSGFCCTITCMDDSIYEPKTVLYTMKNDGEDVGRKFVESLESDLKDVHDILTTEVPIQMTNDDETCFNAARDCYACGLELKDDRVRDHCHLTGKYRGAAHSKCNLKMRTPTFVPVLFHNLEGYDSHLFIKSLGGRISCIPKTDEKYISFSKNAVMGTAIDIEERVRKGARNKVPRLVETHVKRFRRSCQRTCSRPV